jgi:hypothetical protein
MQKDRESERGRCAVDAMYTVLLRSRPTLDQVMARHEVYNDAGVEYRHSASDEPQHLTTRLSAFFPSAAPT